MLHIHIPAWNRSGYIKEYTHIHSYIEILSNTIGFCYLLKAHFFLGPKVTSRAAGTQGWKKDGIKISARPTITLQGSSNSYSTYNKHQ